MPLDALVVFALVRLRPIADSGTSASDGFATWAIAFMCPFLRLGPRTAAFSSMNPCT
jgi:hypothetical protein